MMPDPKKAVKPEDLEKYPPTSERRESSFIINLVRYRRGLKLNPGWINKFSSEFVMPWSRIDDPKLPPCVKRLCLALGYKSPLDITFLVSDLSSIVVKDVKVVFENDGESVLVSGHGGDLDSSPLMGYGYSNKGHVPEVKRTTPELHIGVGPRDLVFHYATSTTCEE